VSATAVTNPTVIPTGSATGPVGIAATTSQVLFSRPFCQTTAGTRVIDQLFPSVSTVFTLPDQLLVGTDFDHTCAENYFAIAQGTGGFAAGSIYAFVVVGGNRTIVKEPGNVTFTTLPPGFSNTNHTFVAFDTVGAFAFNLLVTGQTAVRGYDPSANLQFFYTNPLVGTYALEGATVAPLTFAPCPGCLMVTATGNPNGAILFATPGQASGTALKIWTTNAPQEPESLVFVPSHFCTVNGYSYFVSGFSNVPGANPISTDGAILAYTPAQLAPYSGQFLVPDEVTGNIWAYSGPNTRTLFSATGYQLEGSTIVSCGPGTGCPATQGFWKHHAFPTAMFDSTGHIQIGTGSYTASDLVNILNTPPSGGNAVLILGHQLIAAIANVTAGAQVTPQAATAIAQALMLFTSNNLNLSSTVAASSTLGQQMTALADILDAYNSATGLNCSEGSGLQ